MAFYLVHFRSSDLAALQKQGQFWHVLFLSGAVIISQNERDIWTVHTVVPPGVDPSTLDPYTTVAKSLGANTGKPYEVNIDEVLVHNTWQPSIFVNDKYTSAKSRVFLAGDSAHQLVPTGGYGFNTGVADAVDITWKLAAVLKGYGGKGLLESYEVERMPVAERNNDRSGVNVKVHMDIWGRVAQSGMIMDQGPEGEALRKEVSKHYLEHSRENSSWGNEFGYRYNGSPIIHLEESTDEEPPWSNEEYVPSTWPGARAPHVFCEDGSTSVFDMYGSLEAYTLVDFTKDASFAGRFESEAAEAGIPLKVVNLPGESHVRTIWERDAVLIRPDDHVCWRAAQNGDASSIDVRSILKKVAGHLDKTS